MKYIRTEDGIYETDKTVFGKHTKIVLTNKKTGETISEIVCDYIEEKSIIEDMLFAEYCKTHKLNPLDYSRKTIVVNPTVLNQSDTIEELCDEFVCLENKMTFRNLETITSSCNLKYLTIYGAIWTDKGLIYVAKLNKKGELELL